MRINGIGTTLLSVSKMDCDGNATATVWFTFLFLPIFPIRRYQVQFLPHQGSGFSYRILSEERLQFQEILKTYLYGWLVAPTLILGPLLFGIRENWEALRLPETWYMPYFIFSIVWFGVAFIAIINRCENRCRPPKSKATIEEPPKIVIEEPQEVTTTPGKHGVPWGGITFVLVLVGSVVTALYMVVGEVGPGAWLIELQEQWFGGYYVLYTVLFVWVLLLIIAVIIVGLVSSIISTFKALYLKVRGRAG
jgi:hypothetical protein